VSRPTLVFAIQATQCWTCREVRRVRRADTPRSCKTNEPLAKPYYAKAYSHEEIGSFCLRDPLFGGEQGFERAEADWAQSEVGEGVEELWERSVSVSEKYGEMH
jgi:hypothetical protein